jgi:flagellar biosynthesis protein FlhF
MASRPTVQASPSLPGTGEEGFDIRPISPLLREGGPLAFRWPSDDLAFLGEVLRAQHAPAALVENLIAAAATPDRNLPPEERLAHALGVHFRFADLDQVLRFPALLVVGPPGAGKTALVARLAARLDPRRVLAVSTDVSNAGGLRQLEEYMNVLGVALAVAADVAALKDAVAGATRRIVLIDAPAAAPGGEFDETLRAFKTAAGAEAMLAMPADLDAAEARILGEWAGNIGARLMVATRLDLARRVGSVLAAADAGGLAPFAAALTPHFAYGLKALSPALLARRILTGALDANRWRSARR